jgi:putative DNA-invertase from lambdoid prophage Rac
MEKTHSVGKPLPAKHSSRKSGRRVAAYMRVSTPDQDVRLQRYAIERWWKGFEESGDEIHFFEEKLSSRKRRPFKDQIYKEALKREWDVIVLFKVDRWARSVSELSMDFKALTDRKVLLYSLNDLGAISMDTTMGRAMINMLGTFAEIERDFIRDRAIAGQLAAKERGVRIGRPAGAKDKNYRKKGGYYRRWNEGKFTRDQPAQKNSKQSPPDTEEESPESEIENEQGCASEYEGSLTKPVQKTINRSCPGCGKADFVADKGYHMHLRKCKEYEAWKARKSAEKDLIT